MTNSCLSGPPWGENKMNTYTCRYCRRTGTEEKFDTLRYKNKSGVCQSCAKELEAIHEKVEPKPLTDREIYDQKVDESKEG
jgi:hypothetical protein